MADTKNENLVVIYLEYDPIISHPELPVAPQRLAQRLAILLRGNQEPGLDRLPDPLPHIGVELRNVARLDLGMIDEGNPFGVGPRNISSLQFIRL
jgi:hypothetical protein